MCETSLGPRLTHLFVVISLCVILLESRCGPSWMVNNIIPCLTWTLVATDSSKEEIACLTGSLIALGVGAGSDLGNPPGPLGPWRAVFRLPKGHQALQDRRLGKAIPCRSRLPIRTHESTYVSVLCFPTELAFAQVLELISVAAA